jgi:hypothetical protein
VLRGKISRRKKRKEKQQMELLKSINTSTALFTAAAVCTVVYLMKKKSTKGRKRSLSFSSETLLQGAFPQQANVAQPIINCLFSFAECPSMEKLVPKVRELALFDRFRSGAEEVGPNRWALTDLGPNASLNIERDFIETVEICSSKELKDMVDNICMKPLPVLPDKPLWRVYRIVAKKNAAEPDMKSGILVRVHHVIGDGISLVGAMTKFFENGAGGPFTLDIPEKMSGGNKFKLKFGFVLKFLRSLFKVLMLPNTFYDTNTTFCPEHHPNKVMPKRCVNVELPVFKLDFIKELKNRAGVTVNDVLLAATSGMIKRFSELNDDTNVINVPKHQISKLRTRALVPVAFPRPKKDLQSPATALRNLWSFISVPLVIRENTPKERLFNCAKNTRRLKKSPSALIQLFVQNNILPLLPFFLTQKIAFDVFSRHSIVFSNLPGPADAIKLAGETVLGFQISFPNLIPQVIIISYNNGVFFNLCLDEEILNNSKLPATAQDIKNKKEILVQLFMDEIKELAKDYNISTDEDYMIKKI